MLDWLYAVTTVTNMAALVLSLWLGLFVWMRTQDRTIGGLTALTLWLVSSWFLYNGLQTSLPHYAELSWLAWLGQGIKLAPVVWFQLSIKLRHLAGADTPRSRRVAETVVWLSYFFVILQILDTGRRFPTMPTPGDVLAPVFFVDRVRVDSYIVFLILLFILPFWTLWNLHVARRHSRAHVLRRLMGNLFWATSVALVGALLAGVSVYWSTGLPAVPTHLLLASGVGMLGIFVLRYDALLEGRMVTNDAQYSLAGITLVSLIYATVSYWLYLSGDMTSLAVVAVLVLTVITHTLNDGGRVWLDRLFYRDHFQRLRQDLRRLANQTAVDDQFPDQLAMVLATVCPAVRAQGGWIALRQDGEFVVQAATDAEWRQRKLSGPALTVSEVIVVSPEHAAKIVGGSGQHPQLLAPLITQGGQHGVLALNHKSSGDPYTLADLDYVETVALQVGTMVELTFQQRGHVQQMQGLLDSYQAHEAQLQQQVVELVVEAKPLPPVTDDEERMSGEVEDALRHLHDFAYLGELPLAALDVVVRQGSPPPANGAESGAPLTHVARGKALQTLLIQTINQLKPAEDLARGHAPPGREWHPYLILYDSYVRGELTRDIMARLYIGEGTYNRTRRRAFRAVTKMLQDLATHHTDSAN